MCRMFCEIFRPVSTSLNTQIRYDTIRYDSVYLTCSKKLTGSQLSPPHGIYKQLKCKTKNKTMRVIGPVQSRCHEGSPVGDRSLRWEGFVEKVGFEQCSVSHRDFAVSVCLCVCVSSSFSSLLYCIHIIRDSHNGSLSTVHTGDNVEFNTRSTVLLCPRNGNGNGNENISNAPPTVDRRRIT